MCGHQRTTCESQFTTSIKRVPTECYCLLPLPQSLNGVIIPFCFIYVSVFPVCIMYMHLCMPAVYRGPAGVWFPWNRSNRLLWTSVQVLGSEPRSSAKSTGCWVISWRPHCIFLMCGILEWVPESSLHACLVLVKVRCVLFQPAVHQALGTAGPLLLPVLDVCSSSKLWPLLNIGPVCSALRALNLLGGKMLVLEHPLNKNRHDQFFFFACPPPPPPVLPGYCSKYLQNYFSVKKLPSTSKTRQRSEDGKKFQMTLTCKF